MAKGSRGGKAGSAQARYNEVDARVKRLRTVNSIEEAERTRGDYEKALADRRQAQKELTEAQNLAEYGTKNPTMEDLTRKAWDDYNRENGLPESNRKRLMTVPTSANSIADATKKAVSTVDKMKVGDVLKAGNYTYTKKENGYFSYYSPSEMRYYSIGRGGVEDAIVDAMRIKKRR